MGVYRQKGPNGKLFWIIDVTHRSTDGRSKRIRRNAPLQTRKGAEAYERQVIAALQDGTFEKHAGVPTLSEFRQRYFADHVSTLKASSQSAYASMFDNWIVPKLGTLDLVDLTTERLDKFSSVIRAEGLSARTTNGILTVVRAILSKAHEWEIIPAVPKVRKLKAPARTFRFFDHEEAAKLAAVTPGRYLGAMAVFAMRTGLRAGELMALQWNDISLERKQVTVSRAVWWAKGRPHEGTPKSGKPRTIPLSENAIAALLSTSHRKGYVFRSSTDTRLSKGMLQKPLNEMCVDAGLPPVGWHVLRHTFASHLAIKGVDLLSIRDLLGHADIQQTLIYAHLSPSHLRKAIDQLE